ncbi:patatin [Anopheles sinensis]|uniref:Patatin n=1 Tax=Anopheles sinensis TaxID=74873 RepID=A0A084WGG8_ANOSI|nr:patatin [Anopheles sinensis]
MFMIFNGMRISTYQKIKLLKPIYNAKCHTIFTRIVFDLEGSNESPKVGPTVNPKRLIILKAKERLRDGQSGLV